VDGVLTKPVKTQLLYQNIVKALGCEAVAAPEDHKTTVELPANFATQYPLRILVAEDNPVNQHMAVKMLNNMGYEPEVAVNGLEVLEKIEAASFDLVLMDMQMPEMDGLEATRLLRQARHPVTIIAMTANAMPEDEAMCREAGMNDYLSKPIKVEDLNSMIEKWAVKITSVM
jgi:CheY-like chemotaxis protein